MDSGVLGEVHNVGLGTRGQVPSAAVVTTRIARRPPVSLKLTQEQAAATELCLAPCAHELQCLLLSRLSICCMCLRRGYTYWGGADNPSTETMKVRGVVQHKALAPFAIPAASSCLLVEAGQTGWHLEVNDKSYAWQVNSHGEGGGTT